MFRYVMPRRSSQSHLSVQSCFQPSYGPSHGVRLLLLLLSVWLLATPVSLADDLEILDPLAPAEAKSSEENFVVDEADPISDKHLRWLVEVQPLMTRLEYNFFRTLSPWSNPNLG